MRALEPISFAYCTEFGVGNPSLTQGTALTNAIGASNADGAAAVQIGSGSLTHDCEWIEIIVSDCSGDASTVDSSALLDIVIDPAGGTSWDTTNRLIQSLMVGFLPTTTANGFHAWRRWAFPLWVKSGASFAGIGRTVIAAAQTANVFIRCYGGVNRPSQWWCGQKVDAVGENRASSAGTSVTPSASANTWGTTTNIGSATTRRYGYLVPTACGAGTNFTLIRQMQMLIGGTVIGGTYNYNFASTEIMTGFMDGNPGVFCNVPEGTQLTARVKASGTSGSADQIIIHGVAT